MIETESFVSKLLKQLLKINLMFFCHIFFSSSKVIYLKIFHYSTIHPYSRGSHGGPVPQLQQNCLPCLLPIWQDPDPPSGQTLGASGSCRSGKTTGLLFILQECSYALSKMLSHIHGKMLSRQNSCHESILPKNMGEHF